MTTVIEGADAWRAQGDDRLGHVGIVVVHGFTGNPVSTRPLGERLHADGFTVEVLRLPGHGTTAQEMSTTRYGDWLAAVEAAVDDLEGRCAHVALVGLSMGGTLCLDVASRRDVAAVVTINGFLLDPPRLLARIGDALQLVGAIVPAKLVGIAEDDIKAGGTERAYDTVPARAANSLTRALPRVRAQLRDLTAPALICWSTEDHTVPPRTAQAIVDLLPGPDVRTLELTDSYHIATLDHDAELLATTISEFVAEVTA